MLHGKLKKLHDTLSTHKRKVSALEQTLNINEFSINNNLLFQQMDEMDQTNEDEFNEDNLQNVLINNGYLGQTYDEQKDFEIVSSEYSKLKLQIAQYQQEENEWNNTKNELSAVNKRCDNLMNMLDKLSDEKLQLTLHIEDLYALLNQHNIKYQQ